MCRCCRYGDTNGTFMHRRPEGPSGCGKLGADEAEGDISVSAKSTQEPAPQPVVSPLTVAAVFLVLTISPGGEDTVRDLLPDLSGLGRSVGFRIPEGSLQ